MFESFKNDKDEKKTWKSSGYYVKNWISMHNGSVDINDWKLKNYVVHVVDTSEDFGQTEGGCEGLC